MELAIALRAVATGKDWWRYEAMPEEAQFHAGNSIARLAAHKQQLFVLESPIGMNYDLSLCR